ncbi:unnamed protein product, partial [Adineta steineri]
MIFVIVISHKCKINPDNMVTPIAVSLSDLTTLGILFLLEMNTGNLVAVQASRLSTTLHQQSKPGEFQDITQYHASKFFPNSYKIFCSTTTDQTQLSINCFHIIAALIQVIILLYITQWMIIFVWRHERDPDNIYIPYLTVIGDIYLFLSRCTYQKKKK